MEDNKFIEENEVDIEEYKEDKKSGWKKELFEWVQAIVIAIVISFVLKNYVLTLVKVQGESMEPTLQHADRIYVNRFNFSSSLLSSKSYISIRSSMLIIS